VQLDYEFHEEQGYSVAKVTGEWELDAVLELIDSLVKECIARNSDRLLADFLDVTIAGRVLQFERYLVGKHVGATLWHIRLAALLPEHQINKFGESIAREAGVDFLVTGDRDEAIRWLTASRD